MKFINTSQKNSRWQKSLAHCTRHAIISCRVGLLCIHTKDLNRKGFKYYFFFFQRPIFLFEWKLNLFVKKILDPYDWGFRKSQFSAKIMIERKSFKINSGLRTNNTFTHQISLESVDLHFDPISYCQTTVVYK